MTRGTALVTGASSGIGEALARQFADNEFDLVIVARRHANLQFLAEDLAPKVKVHVIDCDLSTDSGLDKLLNALPEVPIDILINNAGISLHGAFEDQDYPDIENLLLLNINALTRLTHHLLPAMIKRGAGRILNVASVASFQPVPSLSVYAASKAYVLSLSESLSEELRGTGVTVTALCPGLTDTGVGPAVGIDLPDFLVSNVADVAREGYDALMNREVICIPGITNQAAVTWAKHQPRWLIRGIGGLLARFNPNSRS